MTGAQRGIHVNLINGRNLYIRRKQRVTGKQFVQIIVDIIKNLFDIVRVQHSGFGVPRTKPAAIWQLNTVLDRQPTNETTRQLDAIGADLHLFTGDPIRDEVSLAANFLPANGTNIRPRREYGTGEYYGKKDFKTALHNSCKTDGKKAYPVPKVAPKRAVY